MQRHQRRIAAIGFLGCATMGLTPLGCTSRLGPVRASQTEGGIDRPNLPDITVELGSECVAQYGRQLEPGYHRFESKVQVNEDGEKENVTIDDIPSTAYDLGACMRNAFRNMPIAEEPLRQGVATLKYRREQASMTERSLVGSPVVVVVAGVTIIVSELVLEAGAYTILFAVSVEVVEAARRRPVITKSRCLDAAAGGIFLWNELCRAITDPKKAERCWAMSGESEEEKRNWCNEGFGTW